MPWVSRGAVCHAEVGQVEGLVAGASALFGDTHSPLAKGSGSLSVSDHDPEDGACCEKCCPRATRDAVV